jgi:hypothetical protein
MKKILGLAVSLAIAACGNGPLNGDAFVAYYRTDADLTSQQALVSAANGNGKTFYLAVKTDQLSKRWFMSAYLGQVYPGAVAAGAATSLGTRVVSFQVQNGKLFMFDASNMKDTSDTFSPDVVIDAYPIVTDATFAKLPNASKYVLIDPSQSLAQFSLFNDTGYAAYGTQFNITVSFLQSFRALADGATFEQVFTGYSSYSDPNAAAQGEDNTLRASGTLGISLRTYAESPGFTPKALPPQELFFRSPLALVPDTGTTHQWAIHWNQGTHKDKPIQWVISPALIAAAKDPRFAGVDILGAFERGVTNWNAVFGYEALAVRPADVGENDDQDDVNEIVYDSDPTYGYAFANWRTNPITGEVRGASVYVGGEWLEIAYDEFLASSAPAASSTAAVAKAAPRLVWNPMGTDMLCMMSARSALSAQGAGPAAATLTPQQQAENFLTHMVNHEVGHTLGLRHNFEGSLAGVNGSPTSSVMDYIFNEDAVNAPSPQPYDYAAIRYLYNFSTALPAQPFCTDGDEANDPNCAQFDEDSDPLNQFWAPEYGAVIKYAMRTDPSLASNATVISYMATYGNGVAKYVRGGADDATRLAAWQDLIAPARLPMAQAAQPADLVFADNVFHYAIARLWLDDPSLRGDITNDPPIGGSLYVDELDQLSQSLVDVNGVRSFPTRRTCVDVLAHLQDVKALEVLNHAHDALATALPGLTGDAKANTQDLLNRVTAATASYYQ